jgi:putative tryptophan/tyrosine transport system substrate-binding protein
MMDRRRFVLTSLAGVLAAPPAQAQQSGKVYRIGVLSPDSAPPGLFEVFQERLRELGYVEGKNISIESRHAGGQNERLAALANELIALMVDVIFTVNTSAAQAAKKATATIPIVMTRVADPVKSGLVVSISRPGGNITGLSFLPEVLSAKQLELLKEALPRASRVAALVYAGNPGSAITVKGMEVASAQLGLQLLRVSVQNPGDFLGAFETATRNRAEAVVVVDDAMITRYRGEILRLAGKHSLPVISLYKPFVEAGGLIAYGASTVDMYRHAADYVDKILKGAKPADLPIEQPTKFELVINLKTAKALGLTIPPSLLARADQVIE